MGDETPTTTSDWTPDDDEATDEPEGLFTVKALIFSLAETAKVVSKTYGIPINSSVELVKLGVGYHMTAGAMHVPDETDSEPDNIIAFPRTQEAD